jgi:hypothetical protein
MRGSMAAKFGRTHQWQDFEIIRFHKYRYVIKFIDSCTARRTISRLLEAVGRLK